MSQGMADAVRAMVVNGHLVANEHIIEARVAAQPCVSKVLLKLICSMIPGTRRFEPALFREGSRIEWAPSDHALVVDALRGGNCGGVENVACA